MTASELDFIFRPRSIAVIGATNNPIKLGFQFVSYMKEQGYAGEIYPINPKGGEILGLKIYPSLDLVENEVDLVLILAAADTVPQIIRECAQKGVRGVIITSAGFGESGTDGKKLEEEVIKIAQSRGIRIVGPNCMGIMNLEIGLNAAALSGIPKQKGSLGFISQSGSGLEFLFSLSGERGVYFNKAVSSGNEADLNLVDYFEYFSKDSNINVIMMYIEGIREDIGRKFIALGKETTPRKPVVVLKAGRTSVGERAISTHTGALVGKAELYSAVCKQCGIIEANSFEELFDFGLAFSGGRIPAGNRAAVMGAGGPTISISDVLTQEGIIIPRFSQQTLSRLQVLIPSFVKGLENPLDIPLSLPMDEREKVYKVLLEDENTDGLIIHTAKPFFLKKFSEIICRVYSQSCKPLLVGSILSMAVPELHDAAGTLGKIGVTLYPSPERAAKAYSALVRYRKYLRNVEEQENGRVK